MAKENKPRFKNIVLQDADGTLRTFEPGMEDTNIILLVLQREPGTDNTRVMIRSSYTLHAGATLIHELLKENPNIGAALMAVSMKEFIETAMMHEKEKGGPPNETIQ